MGITRAGSVVEAGIVRGDAFRRDLGPGAKGNRRLRNIQIWIAAACQGREQFPDLTMAVKTGYFRPSMKRTAISCQWSTSSTSGPN